MSKSEALKEKKRGSLTSSLAENKEIGRAHV